MWNIKNGEWKQSDSNIWIVQDNTRECMYGKLIYYDKET